MLPPWCTYLVPLALELRTEGRCKLVEDVVDTLRLLLTKERHALKHPKLFKHDVAPKPPTFSKSTVTFGRGCLGLRGLAAG
jgi:hypothetical protein